MTGFSAPTEAILLSCIRRGWSGFFGK